MSSTRRQLDLVNKANAAALVLEDVDARARKALELRRAGYSFFEIAEKMRLPESQVVGLAHQAITSAAALVSQATKAELLALELDRLDAMQSYVWDDVREGDVRAGEYVLKLIAMRMKANGVDNEVQAVTHQTVIITGESSAYRDALARFQQGDVG